jgi:hypothetical protein
MADTTNTTTVHTAEVVRYDDPVIITERVAVSAFIAGYTDPTRRSYATDLRIFAGWCHDHAINLLNVKRPHLEMRRPDPATTRRPTPRPTHRTPLGQSNRQASRTRPRLPAHAALRVHHGRSRRRGPAA